MRGDQTDQSGSIYTFGETDLAAERLQLVSEVFDPTSEAFVSETVRSRPRLALDLGCGPGFTTRLLSRIARPEKTVGVDRSEAFVNRALASAAVSEEYVVADVAAPMRIEGLSERPDLIYARFLASHLPEPERAICCWANELEAGGLLLVEEVHSISTLVAAFEQYLKIVSDMLDHYGNELFIGSRLATARWDDGLRVEVDRTAEVRPSIGQAARMFSTNLANWRHDPYVEANHPPDKLERLAVELDQLTGSAEKGRIAWRMSQIALRRLRRRNHYYL